MRQPEENTLSEPELTLLDQPDAKRSMTPRPSDTLSLGIKNTENERPTDEEAMIHNKASPQTIMTDPLTPISPAPKDELHHVPSGHVDEKSGTAEIEPLDAVRNDPKNTMGEAAYAWLRDMNTRISTLELATKTINEQNESAKNESPKPKPADVSAGDGDGYMTTTIPEVRECNWEEYKNRYPEDGGLRAIETLRGSEGLDDDIEAEQLKRLTAEEKSNRLKSRGSARLPNPKDFLGADRLERVRINSAYILESLSRATGEDWSGKPHTFIRPFKILVHFHAKMEEEYRELEAELKRIDESLPIVEAVKQSETNEVNLDAPEASEQPQASKASATSHDQLSGLDKDAADETTSSATMLISEKDVKSESSAPDLPISEESANPPENASPADTKAARSRKAHSDMQCYINFARSRLMSVYTMFDNVTAKKPTTVRYHDLWSLFRVGELVIRRPKTQADLGRREAGAIENRTGETPQGLPTSHHDSGHTEPLVGKCYWVCANEPNWQCDDLSGKDSSGSLRRDKELEDPNAEVPDTAIEFYYIDHNGEDYGAVTKTVWIDRYDGEKDITELPVYPLRFAKDCDHILSNLRAQGEKFRRIMGKSTRNNMSYAGRTLVKTPLGEPVSDEPNNPANSPLYVESDIIIDFREAYQSHPSWAPEFTTCGTDVFMPQTANDGFPIIQWADQDRTKSVRRIQELVVKRDLSNRDVIANLECDVFMNTPQGAILLSPKERTQEQNEAARNVSDEDLVLLPARVFAYALRERKFIHANLRYVKERTDASDTFSALRISEKHKSFIQSAVFDHFEKKTNQRQSIAMDLEISDQDFISGKGRGLVILLHGAPGVGKTATAEAISQAYNKPLFPITCGNLGTEPATVENTLRDLFRLADLWDCVLLLDEAEIFLSPREKTDDNLQRNALVSVFLRILEYYSGILFLTTNRPGALDEAVKSRVHLNLHFPHLGLDETMSLFRMNLERLTQIERETAKVTGKEPMIIEDTKIMDFAITHYRKFEGRQTEDSRWNGRQIRNAFQIAASLARYQHHLQPNMRYFLGAEHFQRIEEATQDYDEFRIRTMGKKTDSDLAAGKHDRGRDSEPPRPNRQSVHAYRQDGGHPPQMHHSYSSPSVTSGGGSAGGGAGWEEAAGTPRRGPPSPFDPNNRYNTPTPIRPQAQTLVSSLSPYAFPRSAGSEESSGDSQWSGIGRSDAQNYPRNDYHQQR